MKSKDSTELPQDCNSKWLYKDLTEKIIGAAMDVHKILGNGFLEYVYQEALAYELNQRNISFDLHKQVDIWYKDLLIPRKYTPDFFVEDNVIVEIKAINALTTNDEAQLLNYLKAIEKRVGLLLNFGSASLEIRRRIL